MIPFAVVCVITMLVVWKLVSQPLSRTRNSEDDSAPANWSGDGGTPIGGLHHHPWSGHGASHESPCGDGDDCG